MGLNHVYKVIWNKTKGCYVVVSELAKRVGRNKAKAIVMATAAMAMVVTPAIINVGQVEASVLIGNADGTTISANGSTVNSWGITIGGGITNAGSHSVHVGDATLEEGERNVIIGTHATAGVDKGVRQFVRQSTAIGGGSSANEGARAFGDQSIAIGANTIAEGNSSIAIGNDDVDRAVGKQITYTNSEGKEVTDTLGNAYTNLTGKNLLNDGGQYADTRSGEAAVAIGVKAEAGDISLALGTGAKAKKVNTVSIGTGATADLENSVAIGGGAVADKSSQGTKQTSTTINGITYEWKGGDKTDEGDIVSFGKPGFERQLKNIAAGEISSTSTDAINGSQIHSLVEKITGTPKLSYTTKDGTPVYKLGDKFYKVNEKGQPISAAGKPAVGTNEDGKLVDVDNNVIEPIDSATTPLKTALVNSSPEAGKTGTTSPTALNNITSNLVNFDAPNVNGKVPAKNTLRNLVNDDVFDDTVATVGDLRNMGWIVSADKTTGADGTATDTAYSETVKNANEVKFVGKDGAIVSGATDAATGVRTITVGLDKKAMSGSGASASPVAYTKADGTKVYPVKAENGTVTYHTTPNGEGPNDAVVPGTEVITSVDGPEGTTTPATLTNVAGNLVGAKTGTDTPTTEQVAPTVGKGANEVNPNNAATVGDVLNAGWNLQNNNEAKDFVKAYDTVNFINGDGTTAVVETTDNKVSTIKYNVNTGNGLEKDTATNKIQVKPGDKSLDVTEAGVTVKKADQSLEVTDAGLKVKTDGTTITSGDNGLTINTGTVNAVESGDKKGTVEVPTTDAGKIATVDTVVKAVNSASFTLKATATTDGIRNAGSAVDENGEQIKAGSTVELVAGKNLDVKHDTNGKITFATKDEVAFNTVQIGGSEGPKLTKTDSGDLKLSDKDGTKPVAITNVKSNLPETKNGAPAEATKAQPVPTLGTEADQVNANNAATVGDVLNAGWNVQENGTAKDFVKPYDTVNFINGANTTAVVTTSEDGTTSKVTYNVTGLPVSYTTEDGKPVSKVGDKFYKVNEHGQPVSEAGKAAVGTNAEGKLVDADNNVIEPIDPAATPLKTALVNPTPAADKTGTTSPTQLTNVEGNLEGAKTGTNAPTTAATVPNTTDATQPNYVNTHNAATVGDVLQAGWNLQNNGEAKDFVKPYDKVNFVNGGNTTAVVTTNAEGTVSNVSFNVTGLPVSYTTEDGKPVSKVGDKFYKVNEQGQPISEAGKPAVGTNAEGKLVDADNNVIEPIDTTAAPLKTALVNPTPAADKTSTTSPTALNNVTSGLNKYGDQVNGNPVEGTTPANTGLIDLSTPADGAAPKVSDNTAATVGDLRNMGWIVSADKTTGDLEHAYSATVKNANEVKFVGTGTAIVSGETKDGVRTITVNVDDQVSANNAKTPVVYTKADGTKVYPIKGENGVITYHTTPDGKGDNDQEVPGTEVITSVNSPDGTTTPATLANVAGNLDGAKKDTTAPKAEAAAPNTTNKDGDKYINPNNAATVGDVLNAGWNVQENGTAKDFVKPYDKVNFVNGGNTTAVVTTNAEGTVSNVSFNVTGLPVSYTTEDGKPVSKVGDKFYKVNEQGQPISEAGKPAVGTNAEGKLVDADNNVIEPIDPAATPLKTALVNATPAADKTGTTSPTQLTNVEGNLDGAKTGTNAPTTSATAPNTTDATQPNYVNTHNAATVGDVLQAGWNLQNNGEAKDFVKPYDKVNFVNGGNTTAVVTTNAEGTVSNVSFNVTGLPVSYTTEDGKPVSKVGDKFYKVNEHGQPVSEAGKAAVGTNAEGKLVDADNNVIEPIDPAATPLKTALVNPTPAADKTGTTSPTALNNVTSGLNKYGDQVDGKPVEGTTPANTGLIDLSTPADGAAPKVSDNTAATVGDLRNMGWIVSSNKTTGDLEHAYSATVKNANEVKFVGTGTAIVSGETKDGVRTITVNVDDQVSANNAKTPVAYTKADGTKVYPIKGENGVITYHTTPDGKGDNDQEVPGTEVITSVNSPDGTTTPATLANVAGNLDGAKKDTTAPKAEAAAPNTTNKDGDKYINPNNAATVGDVLNAGWNLQENGTAKDFVKPYDTVNFINGANTTAVVTTSEDGTTSKVTYNVTGLPVSYTTEDGKPVSKVGDKFYKVNEKGQPLAEDGTPAAGTDKDGNPITANGTVIKAIDPTVDPLKTALVNPNPEAGKTGTTAPTQLTNVANGADTFKPANDVKQANDGKWYNASDVEPNGKVKDGAKSVASPVATKNAAGDVLEKGKDGNWYKASDLENGEPKPNVDAQTPVAKPENVEKAGLVNFEGSNPNNAATVGDLQNLGFIVSAADNGYTEQMRNANKVEFKGSNGVSVTGKTLEDGTREITVALKEGRVTNNVIITKADGTEVHGERGEDGKYYQYEKDPVTGQPKKVEVPVVAGDTVTNDGDAYVTGNSVATAIQKSGWNIGIGSTDKAFSEEEKTYEHVNPNDHVKYVNGDNTTVSMAVDPEKDRDGTTVTTTYVKVDVKRDLKIDSLTTGGPAKDKDGNSLQEINGEYYPANAVEKDGKAYPAGTVFIDGKAYPAGSAKDPNTNGVVKDGQPATEVQPLTATPKDKVADGKDGAMTVKDAKGKDGVSATAKDGKGVLTLNNAGTDKDGKDASTVNISTGKAPTDLGNTPKDGSEVPTMDRIQYTDGTGTSYNVATMNDGLRFVGDDDKAIDKTLNSTLTLTGGNREATNKPVAEEATTTGNIGVFNKDGKLSIQLAKDLDKLNSANFESKTDKAGNPLKAVDGKYYPENSVVQEGKVYPEGTVIIDNKPYPAGTTKDAAGNVVNNGKPATEATPIKPIDSTQVQDGPTSKLTGTGLNFNTPAPKDENGNPLILVDGKYYKADNLENGKPKAEAKPEAVKPAQSTAITPDGLAITPDTAKVVDPKTGEVTVDSTKVVSFGAPSIVTDPATGKAVIDPKTGEPVMKSGISAGGQVMSNVAPGVLDTDAVNVSQLKGVAHNINMRMNRMGAQAAAMASLQSIQYDPLEPTQISAGVGHYKGASALALGVNHFKNESTMFHMGASLNGHGDESMINASVTWKFGGRADETAVKDTFRQGPISASYTLQDKVSALEEQNQVLKEQVAELFRRLNEKA